MEKSKLRKTCDRSIQDLRPIHTIKSFLLTLLPLIIVVMACGNFKIPGTIDLYEGNNAAQAIAKIKEKIGSQEIKVIRGEIRQNELKIQIQAPDNPKNIDEYEFKNGIVTGPKPVQVISMGNREMTADKYQLTNIDEINFAVIPATVKDAIARTDTKEAKVEVISMENWDAGITNPKLKAERQEKADEMEKQIKAKEAECRKKVSAECFQEAMKMRKERREHTSQGGKKDLVLTWRIFVQSPRSRKDFWADKNGTIVDKPFN